MNYLISIDIGTSSARSVAFSEAGKVLATESVPLFIHSPQPGWQEQSAAVIFQAVLTTLKKVVQTLGAPPLGVSLCTVMHSIMMVDAQGQPLTPMLIWADNRSEPEASALKEKLLGKEIYRHTGTPIHPMSPLSKLAWWRTHEPALFEIAYKFVGIKEYVLFHLFGQWVVDYSVASAMGLLDNEKMDWYEPALEFAGVQPQQLAQLVSPTFILKNINPSIAAQLGMPADTPFVVGANDGCLANLGALALEAGEVAITLGTSAAIRVTGKTPVCDEQERLFNYVLTEDWYVTGGASNNGGIVYQWFMHEFMPENSQKDVALKALEQIAQVPVGAEGLVFLPYLTGERAPVWDAQARGIFYGVTKGHTVFHFQRAVLEGILYNVRQIGQALEEVTGEIQTICVNGGLAEVDVVMQLLADIFGKPVHRLDCEEGSAFGAFILAMKALGRMENFAEARKLVGVAKIYHPEEGDHVIYQAQFDVFQKLYPIFKTLEARL